MSHDPLEPVRTDGALVARIRSGDLDALESVYRTLYRHLWDFAFRYLRSDEGAQDLVHDIFASLWERRQTLDPAVSLDRYLFAAVRNRALQHIRHAYVERSADTVSRDDVPGMGHAPEQPDERAQRLDQRDHVARALGQLSPLQRDVMILRWHRGMSYADVAAVLGVSLDAAKQHGSRAQRALRDLLGEDVGAG